MKIQHLLAAVSVCGLTVLIQESAGQPERNPRRAEPAQPAQPADPARRMDERRVDRPTAQPPADADMEAWLKASTPGEAHARLNALAGRWEAQMTIWHMPGSEPERMTATSRYTWVLGDPESDQGRFLRQEFNGEMMGQPFRGIGYWGYDNLKEQYTCVWMDTMSTSMNVMHGTYRSDDRSVTLRGTYRSPDGNDWNTRLVLSIPDDNRHTLKYFQSARGIEEYQTMEINFTRARGGPPEFDRERMRERMRDGRPGEAPRPGGERPGARPGNDGPESPRRP